MQSHLTGSKTFTQVDTVYSDLPSDAATTSEALRNQATIHEGHDATQIQLSERMWPSNRVPSIGDPAAGCRRARLPGRPGRMQTEPPARGGEGNI